MMHRYVVRYSTAASHKVKLPSLEHVFPKKKMVNRILFQLNSRLPFAKLYPVYEALYKDLQDGTDKAVIPRGVTSSDVLLMKNVLQKIRHQTKSANKHVIALEHSLLEKAAEMGNNDAIALLAFHTLRNSKTSTPEDIEYANKLLKELYHSNHKMTIKLLGDLLVLENSPLRAQSYYEKFLELEQNTFLAGEVYGKLGKIFFDSLDLARSEQYFLKSIKILPLESSVHSYFYLSQLYQNSDPLKAKALLNSCATQGFKESFKALGYLEMNYFNDLEKAAYWFKLGMELFEFECFIGFFDCAWLRKDHKAALKCYMSMQKIVEIKPIYQDVLKVFLEHKHDKIAMLAKKAPQVVKASGPSSSSESRWQV